MSLFSKKTLMGCISLALSASLYASPVTKEYNDAIHLEGDIQRGKEHYRVCIVCHGPEGWGNRVGSYPQIAGQLPSVIIKQLADFRAGNRDNPMMRPFTTKRILPDAQAIADIAAYIAQLPMTRNNGRGPGFRLAEGEALYAKECAECHGEKGEGIPEEHIPLLYGQHFSYLMRQFDWIRTGMRRNADEKMVKQIQRLHPSEIHAIMDYISHLSPPDEKLAKEGWENSDFPNFHRQNFNRHIGQ